MDNVVFLFEYPHAARESSVIEPVNILEIVEAHFPKSQIREAWILESAISNKPIGRCKCDDEENKRERRYSKGNTCAAV